jgi:glycosyltransferase involved in cell wall biosynthesis
MRITWLLETADQLWGGVKVALEDANWLAARGHQVTVLSRSGPPPWMHLRCAFQQVQDFRPEHLPDADVVIGTFWTTVPWAAAAKKGVPVHFCQGYEGDNAENETLRDRIEAVYRLPGVAHITISPHLTKLLHDRFGIAAREVIYAIDHEVHFAAQERGVKKPLRIGLVGPWQIPWKDIATGMRACALAAKAGLPLQVVRVTNTAPHADERAAEVEVEWHERLPPSRMGEVYRSCDVFLGTSSGSEEGFFLPAIEAMANGVPCVLTDVPCFRGYGSGQYALFVPPKDPRAMAEAIVVAAGMPDLRLQLRRAGLQIAARFNRDAHGQQLEAALQATIAAPPTPQPAVIGPPANGAAQQALQVAVAMTRTLREGAAALHALGDLARASDFLAAAAIVSPEGNDDADVHMSRGLLLTSMGRPADAVQAFRAAIAAGLRSADTYNHLGLALYRAGDRPGAKHSFHRALDVDPAHATAKANLAALTTG